MTRRRNPDLDPRLLAADGARYFSPEALAEADEEGSAYKSRTALVLMRPQDFLDMAEPGKREESQATLERVLNAGIGLADVPRLFVSEDRNDPRIAHVTGHEGRHRSRALLARGVTQMPVRIHSQTIRWSEQSDPKSWDYDEQLPERLFGEGANRRNVLPMPVPLHYPELAPRMRPARANPRRRRNPAPTRSAAFRRWFGDSKVVDAAGEPLVVYHAGFDVLRSSDGVFRLSHSGRAGMGIYFTPSFSGAERYLGRAHAMHQDHVKIAKYDGLPIPPPPAITAAYLSVQNPVIVDRRDGLEPSESLASKVVPKRRYRNLDYELEDLLRYTRKAGYDGVFVTNGEEVEEIVVFDPRQVKSATANVGTFDPADPDLRRNPRRSEAQTSTPAFRAWFGASKVVDEDGKPLVAYHGTGTKFEEFKYWRPNFFSLDKAYAEMYADKGTTAKKKGFVMPVFLRMERPFDTSRDAEAVRVYNDEFLPMFRKIVGDAEADRVPRIRLGEGVSFIVADDVWAFLRDRWRLGDHTFDGLLVDEGGFDEAWAQVSRTKVDPRAKFALVPLFPTQIKSATKNEGTFTPNDPNIYRNPRRRRNPEDYHMRHRPSVDGPLAHELWKGEYVPEDILQHPEWYTGFQQYLRGFWPALRAAQRRPKAVLRIYRALPKPHATFREGDWVTLSRDYAQVHLDGPLGGEGHIIEADVPADTLRFAGDDLMEWGYWGPTVEATPLKNRRRR